MPPSPRPLNELVILIHPYLENENGCRKAPAVLFTGNCIEKGETSAGAMLRKAVISHKSCVGPYIPLTSLTSIHNTGGKREL